MSNDGKAAMLREIANDAVLLVAAHRKIEAALIDFRDQGISVLGRGNGLVVRAASGEASDVIRMTVQEALQTALSAMADELTKEES